MDIVSLVNRDGTERGGKVFRAPNLKGRKKARSGGWDPGKAEKRIRGGSLGGLKKGGPATNRKASSTRKGGGGK